MQLMQQRGAACVECVLTVCCAAPPVALSREKSRDEDKTQFIIPLTLDIWEAWKQVGLCTLWALGHCKRQQPLGLRLYMSSCCAHG